jgi:serine protease
MSEMWPARPTIALAAALALTAALGQGSAQASSSGPPTTGRALIEVRTPAIPTGDGAAAAEARHTRLGRSNRLLSSVARRNHLTVDARSAGEGLIATGLDGASIDSLRQRLGGDPLVEGVHPEYAYRLMYTPSDPAFTSRDPHAPGGDFGQWNLLGYGAPRAWDLSRGAGAEVAVLDSGVDVSHPDLAGRISGTLDCGGSSCSGTGVSDTVGHGTHVAGLTCATSDDRYGIASVGFDCSIYAIKLGFTTTLPILGGGITEISIINAIRAAGDRGVDAINMSFGCGGADASMKSAIDYAWARGAVPVAAADNYPDPASDPNCTYPDYPAQYVQPDGTGPSIDSGEGLVVTSASHSGSRSAFAQRTNGVSVAAFGSATDQGSGGQQGILSTFPTFSADYDAYGVRTSVNGDNRFAYLSGTSMAAPQVSGLVALIRSAKPSLSAVKVVRLIKLTASNCGAYGGGIGWGIVRADEAVAGALDKDIDPPRSYVRSAKRTRRTSLATASSGRGRVVRLRLKRRDAPSAHCGENLPVSGVKKVAVFASANGGAYHRIATTRRETLTFRAKRHRRYRFYSVAVDKAGNRESPPPTADAKL